MANDDTTDLKIGVALDTSQLPAQAAEAERKVRDAVERTTASVTTQGEAAEKTGKAHAAAATNAGKAMQKMGNTGNTAGATLAKGLGSGTAAVGGLTSALNIANSAMGMLTRGFAIIGLFNQVVASIKMVMEWWQKATEKAVSAGEKFAAAWKSQREAGELLKKQNAPLDALNELIAANDTLLERMRQRASFEAEMRGMDARREGNLEAAAKAQLDGALARGEISEKDHIAASRQIEDAARARTQQNELKPRVDALESAITERQQAESEHDRATQELNRFRSHGSNVGGGAEYFGIGDLQRAASTWANMKEGLGKAGWATDDATVRAMEQRLNNAEEFILRAADTLDVTTKDGQGQAIPMTELAQAVKSAWEEGLKKREEKVKETQAAVEPSRVAEQQAQTAVDALRMVHESANALVGERRRQEDATRAVIDVREAEKTAQEAQKTAERAEQEVAKAQQRALLEDRLADRSTRAGNLRADYDDALQRHKDAATPRQGNAFKALESLLKRAEKEEQVPAQILAALSGKAVQLGRDDARRYGRDLREMKAGDWSREQKQGIKELVNLLIRTVKAESKAQSAEKAVQNLSRQDKKEGLEARQDAARHARQKADAAAARLPQASAATPGMNALAQGEQDLAAAANQLTALTDNAAGNLSILTQHVARMATCTEKNNQATERALAQIGGLAARLTRLERQSKESKR